MISEEKMYLKMILGKLGDSLIELDESVSKYENEYKESMKYLWQNRSGMDKMEILSNEKSVSQIVNAGELMFKRKVIIEKLMDSPYFARIDFKYEDDEEAQPFYIGRFSYVDRHGDMLIYDWRSPISGMYYDFELGEAFYKAPMGIYKGDITLKRQYKIKNSIMDYAIESSIGINDEVLQKELSHTSDQKMKNIVATIQKEQNQIIRNEKADVLVIQGVAGSGKTSIALHRVAYFLYKYKEQLSAQNIMIISPNKVFADYISNVLPELGEEPIVESSFDDIAAELLGSSFKVDGFFKEIEVVLNEKDYNLAKRIKFKSSFKFFQALEEYIDYADENCFCPRDCAFGKVHIAKAFIETKYKSLKSKPVLQRIEEIVESISEKIKMESEFVQRAVSKEDIKKQLVSMLRYENLLAFYVGFFEYIGCADSFMFNGKLEASDIYPYLYLKMYYEGIYEYKDIKHLVIDEMQDYTPVQYAVIKKLFPCKKTILGDFGQKVNEFNTISKDVFINLFEKLEFVEIRRSYRSTYEIIKFAQKIQNHAIEPIERHGNEPQIMISENKKSEISIIDSVLEEYALSKFGAIGIICKTNSQVEEIYMELCQKHDVSKLHVSSSELKKGIIITSVHMAKGLEFDEVIIPWVNSEVYKSEQDRSLLYIACTRAMHKLTLTGHGEISPLLKEHIKY